MLIRCHLATQMFDALAKENIISAGPVLLILRAMFVIIHRPTNYILHVSKFNHDCREIATSLRRKYAPTRVDEQNQHSMYSSIWPVGCASAREYAKARAVLPEGSYGWPRARFKSSPGWRAVVAPSAVQDSHFSASPCPGSEIEEQRRLALGSDPLCSRPLLARSVCMGSQTGR